MYNLMYNGDVLMSLQLRYVDPCFVKLREDCARKLIDYQCLTFIVYLFDAAWNLSWI